MADETSPPVVRVQQDGPYVVAGDVALRRRRQVVTDDGEPLTWRTTRSLDGEDGMALCRCGNSGDKPFCDGSHADGFNGTERAPTDAYDDRAATYRGTGLVVRDDRSICEHAGFCGNEATNVWKMVNNDTVADTPARSQAIAMIERCPSGALTYRMPGDDEDVEPELPCAIAVVDDGPLVVTGGVAVERSDGEPLETRNRMTLCRCGYSGIKPLCDGSHVDAGFEDS